MQKINLLSLSLSQGFYNSFFNQIIEWAKCRQSKYTCLTNVHMMIEAYKNPGFAKMVNDADLIIPDGMPLKWGLRFLYGVKQERIAGMELLADLLKEAENQKLTVFFYGGTENMLQKTRSYLKRHYPLLNIVGLYSPPFRPLSPEEEMETINKINASEAHLVFVALGCPKQEKWMAKMKGKINAVMVGVGGAVPMMVGLQKRAPQWVQNIGMEWFFRLIQEPRRLFKRYAITNSIFIYLLIKEWIRIRILSEKRMFKKIQAGEKTDACT